MNYHANLKPENYERRGEEEKEGETEKQENGRRNAKRTKLDRRSCGRDRKSPDQRPDAPSIQADATKQRQEEAQEGEAGKTKPGGGGTEDYRGYPTGSSPMATKEKHRLHPRRRAPREAS